VERPPGTRFIGGPNCVVSGGTCTFAESSGTGGTHRPSPWSLFPRSRGAEEQRSRVLRSRAGEEAGEGGRKPGRGRRGRGRAQDGYALPLTQLPLRCGIRSRDELEPNRWQILPRENRGEDPVAQVRCHPQHVRVRVDLHPGHRAAVE
jgi:hypothetical protein